MTTLPIRAQAAANLPEVSQLARMTPLFLVPFAHSWPLEVRNSKVRGVQSPPLQLKRKNAGRTAPLSGAPENNATPLSRFKRATREFVQAARPPQSAITVKCPKMAKYR